MKKKRAESQFRQKESEKRKSYNREYMKKKRTGNQIKEKEDKKHETCQ